MEIPVGCCYQTNVCLFNLKHCTKTLIMVGTLYKNTFRNNISIITPNELLCQQILDILLVTKIET